MFLIVSVPQPLLVSRSGRRWIGIGIGERDAHIKMLVHHHVGSYGCGGCGSAGETTSGSGSGSGVKSR